MNEFCVSLVYVLQYLQYYVVTSFELLDKIYYLLRIIFSL